MKNSIYPLITFVFAFLVTLILTKSIIPVLKKVAKQPIYEEGPSWHLSKSGTPTMGGIAFIIAITIIASIYSINIFSRSRNEWFSLIFTLAFALCNSLVGLIDDVTKLKRAKNGGLTPKQKIILQTLFSVLFLFGRSIIFGDSTKIYFGKCSFDIGIAYYILALIVLLGIINCANLTDGIDGLASSVAFTICIFLFFASSSSSISMLSIIAAGAVLGFLVFNIHPAKIFMGDTGSLFLGAFIASAAFSTKAIPSTLTVSIVYIIEGVTVILQVLYYKKTKKRLFKMAPLHHHLEKCGYDESTICIFGIMITMVFSILSYVILPR
jgi:phospho-N-acetylmuramoyl-pentapeptide-transferase